MTAIRAQLARAVGRRVRVRGADRIARLLLDPQRGGSHLETVTTAWDGTRYAVDTRSFIEWQLFVHGAYERGIQRAMLERVGRGDVVVDCGANVGVHTCALARAVGPEGSVLAIEPIAEVAARLRQNCDLNGLANVEIVVAAVSDAPGRREIFAPPGVSANQGQASFHRRESVVAVARPVEVETVDRLVATRGGRAPRLIKVDVEGDELAVLRGAGGTLRDARPIVVFEYDEATFRAGGVAWGAVESYLARELDYELEELDDDGRPHRIERRPQSASCLVLGTPR